MSQAIETISRPGGRKFGFSQYGDPKGKPLFLFHGWPGSRLGGAKYDALARKLHIRIIAPDRPGYGQSEYQTNRTLLDWPDDVTAVATHLKLKKFAVMGVSGGGPYAAACAYKIPHRITKAGIVVGLAPTSVPHILDDMPFLTRMGWKHYGNPMVRTGAVLILFFNARYGLKLGLHQFFFGAKADKALYKNISLRDSIAVSTREAFRQGYKGPLHDLKLYSGPWGFDVSAIRMPVYLWYGQDDQNVPLAMANHYASQIPGSRRTVYPGEGHLISITHAEEILSALVS